MYVRSPAWLRRALSVPLRAVPVSWRHGGRYYQNRERIAHLRADTGARAAFVERQRSEILAIAATAPYYNDVFQRTWPAGVPTGDAVDGAWQTLPILTKDIIRAQGNRLLATTSATVGRVSTSGSSGTPLAFVQDEKRSVLEFAYVTDAWSRAGYRPGDLRCVIRHHAHDERKKLMEFEPALGELRCSPFDMSDEPLSWFVAEIRRKRIRYILGYTSAIALLADYLVRTGQAPFDQIAGIFPISERVLPRHRDAFAEAFPAADVVTTYGQSEKVAFAIERSGEADVYEFDPTYGYAELVDEHGRQLRDPGAEGSLVGTGFVTRVMPFLRYEIGDQAKLVEAPTKANGYRLVVRGITSRHQSYLVSKTGTLISPASLTPNAQSLRHVSEFQFFQERPGVSELKVVPAQGAAPAEVEAFVDEMRSYVGTALDIVTVPVERIATTERGKRKMIDQRIALNALAGRAGFVEA